MTPEEFRKTFTDYVLRGGSAWTLMAETSRGRMPAAIVIGASANGIIAIAAIIWMPWVSLRARLQSIVNWLNVMRRQSVIFEYAKQRHKRLFEHICRYGLMRRVGTIYDMAPEPIAFFQSRKP